MRMHPEHFIIHKFELQVSKLRYKMIRCLAQGHMICWAMDAGFFPRAANDTIFQIMALGLLSA